MVIPKIIHYCWFGDISLSPLAIKCMESWRKFCPDYEIKLWNENNFNVNISQYSREFSKIKKWAFVSDIVRFYAIYNYGGVYLDTDVEILRPIDELLNNDMFIGFESMHKINTGQGFGAKKKFPLVKKMLDMYEDIPAIMPDGNPNMVASPTYTSKIMEKEGFILNNTYQKINGVELFPSEYFCPKEWWSGDVNITQNTFSIHHFDASWWSDEDRKDNQLNAMKQKILKFYKDNGTIK